MYDMGTLAQLIREGKARIKWVDADVTLVNNTANNVTVTCPKWCVWLLVSGMIYNGDNVNRGMTVRLRPKEGFDLAWLFSGTVNTTLYAGFPDESDNHAYIPELQSACVLDEGWGIHVTWAAGGVSAGGTGSVWLYVIEVDKQ